MDPAQPLVSVVIPAYNHQDFVERSIRSVLDQTYHPVELIVVDDGSPDATLAVIERVHQETGGAFTMLTKPNGGVASTLNEAIRHAHGKYIAILASDDRFLPEKLARQVALFEQGPPEVGAVHCNGYDETLAGDAVLLTGSYVPAEGACLRQLIARGVTAIASSVMVRREAYDRTGGFDETLVGEDLDFYAAVAAQGYEFRYDPSPLMVKTAAPDSLGSKVELFFDDPFKTLAKYRDRFTPTEYRAMEDGFYAGMGRAAAGVGKHRMSWRAYRTLAQRRRNPSPMLEFAVRNSRHLVLSAIPQSWRARLKQWRTDVRTSRAATRLPPASIL
ncbi:glycosyltransferase family A protein [Sphingomonas sp. CARO-RG-8B-R24-01]|uniref:glycosyltransferase family 2 protein n=1 Tax=Sphingomonas sp. CARO-RG-8B-R24-01 TaxID=2914831 RepID=UPI001F563290|nr:glycosyltransferase family A protein [Sphingomonas sp. CARO-RG-8B-R24-01]